MNENNYLDMPIFSEKSERHVLGTMILYSTKIPEIKSVLRSKDYFYVYHHQLIYQIILDLYEHNKKIDMFTISENLRNLGVLEDAGGYSYIMDICDEYMPTGSFTEAVKIIEESYLGREMVNLMSQVKNDIYNNSFKTSVIINEFYSKIDDLLINRNSSGLEHISADKEYFKEKYKALKEGKKEVNRYITTGIKAVDDLIIGVKPTDLIIVAGRPGMGKSAFITNVASNIALNFKKPVALFSLEMDRQQINERIISSESGFSTYYIDNGMLKPWQYDKLIEVTDRVLDMPIFIDDDETGDLDTMTGKLHTLKNMYGDIGAILLDYMQLCDIDDDKNETQELAKLSRGLKKLARKFKAPVFALSQLNRNVEQRSNKRPLPSDLRSSGAIEQDADKIFLLYRDEFYNPDTPDTGIAEINIAKHRNGAVGTVKTFFDKTLVKFRDLEV